MSDERKKTTGRVPRVETKDLDLDDPFAPPGWSLKDPFGDRSGEGASVSDVTAEDLQAGSSSSPAMTKPPSSVLAPPSASEPTAAALNETATFARGSPRGASSAASTSPSSTSRGHLDDLGVFARGGFGSIHRVLDRRFRRRVAMKVLETDDVRAHVRFLQEGQVTAQLAHPNIVSVHEAGAVDGGAPFFTMHLVRGDTLARVCEKAQLHKASELHRVLQIVLRICDAVSFAHARGVVHRDLKPDNVMVGGYGQVYVMDWGIAHVLGKPGRDGIGPDEDLVEVDGERGWLADRQGTVVGTPSYMAPEQAQGRIADIDERTDVFAIGAILYFILTGTAPYRGKSSQEKLLKAQACDIEPPEQRAPHRRMPPALKQIVKRALEEDLHKRYQSVRELKEDLESFLRGGWWFESRTYAPGDVIVREGEEGDAAYIITGGTAEVYRNGAEGEVLLATMAPGDVFGETAILTSSPRIASVRAASPLTVQVVTRETVQDRLSHDSWMAQIVSTLARRWRQSEVSGRQPAAPGASSSTLPSAAPAIRPAMAAPPPPVAAARGKNPFDDSGSVLESSRLPAVLEALKTGMHLDDAAALYEEDDGRLGPTLLEWAEAAPGSVRLNLARVLERARDFVNAARAYELAERHDEAAPLFEKAGDFASAGAAYRQAGEPVLAAQAFERAGEVERALACFDDAGLEAERAALLVRFGRYWEAAQAFRTHGDHAAEVAVLRRVPLHDESRVPASLRLSALMVSSKRYEEAAQLLSDTLAAWNDNHTSAQLGAALSQVYVAMGRPEDAERIREWLREVGTSVNTLDAEAFVQELPDDAMEALPEGAFEERAGPLAYARLKDMPLFSSLSLSEMKDLLALAERRPFAAGDVVVEQGAIVGGLYVIVEGALSAGRRALAAGDTVGEVTLLVGGGTASRVSATADTVTIFLERARLQRWLDTHEVAARGIYRTLATTMAQRVSALATDG